MTSWTDRTTEPDASTAWCLFIALRPAYLRELNYALQCTFGEQELTPMWLFTLTTTCFLFAWASACAHMFVYQVHFKTVLPLETLLVGSLVQRFLIRWENETHACYTPLFPLSGVNWRSFRSGWLACLVKVHSFGGHPGELLHTCYNWNPAGSNSSKMMTLQRLTSLFLVGSVTAKCCTMFIVKLAFLCCGNVGVRAQLLLNIYRYPCDMNLVSTVTKKIHLNLSLT